MGKDGGQHGTHDGFPPRPSDHGDSSRRFFVVADGKHQSFLLRSRPPPPPQSAVGELPNTGTVEDHDHDENYQANAMHCRRIVRELEPTELINKVVFSSSCEERVKSYLQEYELQRSQAKHGFSARVCSIRDLGEKK